MADETCSLDIWYFIWGFKLEIRYKKQAVKYIETLDSVTKKRIKVGIEGLTRIPPTGDIKKLQGMEDSMRLRVGGYRVIYRIVGNTIVIDRVDSRGGIYK